MIHTSNLKSIQYYFQVRMGNTCIPVADSCWYWRPSALCSKFSSSTYLLCNSIYLIYSSFRSNLTRVTWGSWARHTHPLLPPPTSTPLSIKDANTSIKDSHPLPAECPPCPFTSLHARPQLPEPRDTLSLPGLTGPADWDLPARCGPRDRLSPVHLPRASPEPGLGSGVWNQTHLAVWPQASY